VNPVAYYWGGKYFEYADLLHFPEKRKPFEESLASDSIAAVALPQQYIETFRTLHPNYETDLTGNFTKHRNFGGEKGIEVYY